MKKIIIYCHGYNSSAQTDKVEQLRTLYPEHYVYAFDINVDPEISMPAMLRQIDWCLVGHINEPISLVFIGTSLGAWYAHRLGVKYAAKTLLINPSYAPAETLKRYGVPAEVCARYAPTDFTVGNNYVVVGDQDTVLSYLPIFEHVDRVYPGADHRFGGSAFLDVVQRFVRSA